MDLTSTGMLKSLLKKHGIRPAKKLGQNFLIDRSVLKKIVGAADLRTTDTCLEIGPGIGTLTKELAQKTKMVIAIEKDPKMVEISKETLKDCKNVEITQADILKIGNLKSEILNLKSYKVVANLPYYITAPVIRKFLESVEVKPQQMVLMVQKEVAQRICAKPPRMNILAVSVQFYANPKVIAFVSKKSFWPQPKVDSAIIKIVPRSSAYGSASFRERFFRIVRAGFCHPRKQILNNFSEGLALSLPNGLALSLPNGLKLDKGLIRSWLLQNNIQPSQRAESLSVEDWINLTKTFSF